LIKLSVRLYYKEIWGSTREKLRFLETISEGNQIIVRITNAFFYTLFITLIVCASTEKIELEQLEYCKTKISEIDTTLINYSFLIGIFVIRLLDDKDLTTYYINEITNINQRLASFRECITRVCVNIALLLWTSCILKMMCIQISILYYIMIFYVGFGIIGNILLITNNMTSETHAGVINFCRNELITYSHVYIILNNRLNHWINLCMILNTIFRQGIIIIMSYPKWNWLYNWHRTYKKNRISDDLLNEFRQRERLTLHHHIQ